MNTASGKLSNSLRDRLKRCGRYHCSPKPSPGQPVIIAKQQIPSTLESSGEEYDVLEDQSNTGCSSAKRQCVTIINSVPSQTDHEADHSRGLSDDVKTNCHFDDPVFCDKRSDTDLHSTPNTVKARPVFKMRGSKLRFDDKAVRMDSSKLDQLREVHSEREPPDIDATVTPDNVIAAIRDSPGKEHDDQERTIEDQLCHSDDVSVLEKELKKQEDKLRKLNLVKMYRTKNNLEELQTLIDKWRSVSQQALQDLHDDMPEPKPSLTELINHLGIDHALIQFNAEEDETFY